MPDFSEASVALRALPPGLSSKSIGLRGSATLISASGKLVKYALSDAAEISVFRPSFFASILPPLRSS
jgi:hypothetical protein